MTRDARNITVDFTRYVDTWDYVILAFEFVYYIFVAYYIVEEVLEIIKIGKKRSVTINPLVKLKLSRLELLLWSLEQSGHSGLDPLRYEHLPQCLHLIRCLHRSPDSASGVKII